MQTDVDHSNNNNKGSNQQSAGGKGKKISWTSQHDPIAVEMNGCGEIRLRLCRLGCKAYGHGMCESDTRIHTH